jgi:UDP-N-acetylmuramate dehydrogenase
MHTKLVDFSKFSSIKVGSTHPVNYIDDCAELKGDYYLIGACNNLIVGNNPPPLLKLSKQFDFIHLENNRLIVGAATPSGKLASFCKKNNIGNFEFLSHLPGTLGGLIYMNAGLKEYEVFNLLHSISTCHDGKRKNLLKSEIDFGYRFTNIETPILEAIFSLDGSIYDEDKVKMFQTMRNNQPSTPSAGSCFKNPCGDYAGRLIEAVGLKGKRMGDMAFSEIHANFLVNYGKGSFDDAIRLINDAQTLVEKQFGIKLELEIKILDLDYNP